MEKKETTNKPLSLRFEIEIIEKVTSLTSKENEKLKNISNELIGFAYIKN